MVIGRDEILVPRGPVANIPTLPAARLFELLFRLNFPGGSKVFQDITARSGLSNATPHEFIPSLKKLPKFPDQLLSSYLAASDSSVPSPASFFSFLHSTNLYSDTPPPRGGGSPSCLSLFQFFSTPSPTIPAQFSNSGPFGPALDSSILRVLPNPNLPSIPFFFTFRGTRRALRHLQSAYDILSFYVSTLDISPLLLDILFLPTNRLVPFLSVLKTVFHTYADILTPDWKHYIDLASLAGYVDMALRESTDDPQLWLSSPVQTSYGASWWEAAFRSTFAENIRHLSPNPVTYREFVLSRWLWVTGGSSAASRAVVDGKIIKTKFGAAVSLDDDELLDIAYLRNEREYEIGVFIKPDEIGFKRRLIANVSLGPYILASYIRYLIISITGPNPSFAKLETSVLDTVDVIKLIRQEKVMMPLDESAYDYHVSREAWLGFFSFLKSTFVADEGALLVEAFFQRAYWAHEGHTGRWVSGMPSGLALTSFLNSWINYIKQQHLVPGHLQWAAGDDVLVSPFSPVTLGDLSQKYAAFGSEVNPTKNWLSTSYAEYLKVLYHGKGTSGYVARVYASLIWAGKERAFSPPDRLNELAELFKQFYDRAGLPFDEKLVSADLSRAISRKISGFRAVDAREWLHSPGAYGGFGLLPYNDIVFDWSVPLERRSAISNTIIRVPEVIRLSSSGASLNKFRQPISSGVAFHLGSPLRLPPITSIQDWENRINGTDNPLKGKFRNMALDTVPLPKVAGVSTSVMSKFAKMWNYNVFPNLRGNTGRIPSKLVLASLSLASEVSAFMQRRRLTELAN